MTQTSASYALYLESRLTLADGDPRFLFRKRGEDDEPEKAKASYRYYLNKVWKYQEFKMLLQQVGGAIGIHSMRKFPATCIKRHVDCGYTPTAAI